MDAWLSLIVLVALGTIAGLTVVSVQGGSAAANAQRFSSMAMYAAESGAAAAMAYVKTRVQPANDPNKPFFTDLVRPNNDAPLSPTEIAGNTVQPGQPGNLLSGDQQGWYEVTLLNNRADPGFTTGKDADGIIIIQAIGHGPNGAVKKLEWEVRSQNGVATEPLVLVGWHELF